MTSPKPPTIRELAVSAIDALWAMRGRGKLMLVEFEALVGRRIESAHMHDGNIYLVTDDGLFELEPEGDCCANAYVNGVEFSEVLHRATVQSVEYLEMPRELDTDDGCIDAWGQRIITERGICTIDMRVSHNGYYGGYLHCIKTKKKLPQDAEPLKDFST